mmetsp:Transcript_135327/g.306160  ORF Transcript_135327/g.306160 Transcript_135327/m.306160 type:complete len:87 (-) Transcript_135327:17-277(-)
MNQNLLKPMPALRSICFSKQGVGNFVLDAELVLGILRAVTSDSQLEHFQAAEAIVRGSPELQPAINKELARHKRLQGTRTLFVVAR